jgi:hypothetical protein
MQMADLDMVNLALSPPRAVESRKIRATNRDGRDCRDVFVTEFSGIAA